MSLFGSNTGSANNNWGASSGFGRSTSFSGTSSGTISGNNDNKPAGFGLSTSANTTNGGLFGSSSGTTNLFGNSSANKPTINMGTSNGTGSFGSTGNNASVGGGLFGNSSTTTSTSNNPKPSGLFGSSVSNNTGTNSNTNVGLFGNSSKTNSGGLFGGSSNSTTGGGLFGNSSVSQTNGLFGSSSSNNSNNNTGGLLGGSSNNKPGLFGSSNTSGGLFGSSNQSSLLNQTPNIPNVNSTNPYGDDQAFTKLQNNIDNMPASITETVFQQSKEKLSGIKRGFSSLESTAETTKTKSSLLNKLGKTFKFFRNSASASNISSVKGLFTQSNYLNSKDKLGVLPKTKSLTPKRISKQSYKSNIESTDIASIKRLVIKSKPLKFHLIDADKVFNAKRRRIMTDIVSSDKLLNGTYSSDDEESDDEIVTKKRKQALSVRFPYKILNDEEKHQVRNNNKTIIGENFAASEDLANDPDNKDSNNGYWCTPSVKELSKYSMEQLANVENFIVGRVGFGQIAYNYPVDLSSLALLAQKNNNTLNKEIFGVIVKINHKNVQVYDDENNKPPIGFGLNIPATITLEGIKPKEGTSAGDYIKILQCQIGMEFVTYDPITSKWVFKVRHFSVWGLIDETEDTDNSLLELKRKQDAKEPEASLEYSRIYENPKVSNELKKLKLSYDTNGLPGSWGYNESVNESPLSIKRGLLKTEIDTQIDKFKTDKTAIELSANVSDITIESSESETDLEIIQEEPLVNKDKDFDYLKQFFSVLPKNARMEDIIDEKAYEPEILSESVFDNIRIKPNVAVSDDWLIQLELANDINSSLNPLAAEKVESNKVSIKNVDEILFSDFNRSSLEKYQISTPEKVKKDITSIDESSASAGSITNINKVMFHFLSNSQILLRANKFPSVKNKSTLSFQVISQFDSSENEDLEILKLCSALFDNHSIPDEYNDIDKSDLDLTSHLKGLQQRKLLSDWLKEFNKDKLSNLVQDNESGDFESIFYNICAGNLKQAIDCAINTNNSHLSVLLTLLDSNDDAVEAIAKNQLANWKENSILNLIPEVVQKVYSILAGNLEEAVKDLPWNISLAIRLYYGDENLKLDHFFKEFKNNIADENPVIDIFKSYQAFKTSKSEALKLISSSNLSLKLKWYISKILSTIDTDFEIDDELSLLFGKYLDQSGLWSHAIFVYSHLSGDVESQDSIRRTVISNINKIKDESNNVDKEEYLVNALRIPNELIYEAVAIYQKSLGNPWKECKALISAKLWILAHTTIVERLGPISIVSNNVQHKNDLLALISKFPENGLIIPDWNQGANIYRQFIEFTNTPSELPILESLLANIPLVNSSSSFESQVSLKLISKKVGEYAFEHRKKIERVKEKVLALKLGENELSYFSLRLDKQ